MLKLPIDTILPELRQRLGTSGCVVVEAPPGSGKTTRVAPELVRHSGSGPGAAADAEGRIYLIQPRRVAARAAAQRIASEYGWTLGQEVGYHVRFDRKLNSSTKLVVATEGILLRRMLDDPTLDGVSTVILDEFHERSINSDLLLAMLRRVQSLVRDDLRLIVMSATLETSSLVEYLQCPVLTTTGTLHPVEVKYRPVRGRQRLNDHVVETIRLTVDRSSGDVLVFLPGVGEISAVRRELERDATPGCEVLELHGSLPLEQQSRVLRESDQRKIVLSTNVAETSLTIEGIRVVIDSGQARVLRFEPAVGLDRLSLEPICQSSATQRAGRAGRLGPGTCIRLWDERTQRSRPEHLEAEIRRVDLAAALLQLYAWGEDPNEFPWFQRPRDESIQAATTLLNLLGAIHEQRITPVGLRMAQLPIAPRLARMLIDAESDERLQIACLLAAMLSERSAFLKSHARNVVGGAKRWSCDVSQRLLAITQFFATGQTDTAFGQIHRGAAHNLKRVAQQYGRILGARQQPGVSTAELSEELAETWIPRWLLAGFPDRLAKRRQTGSNKGRMVGGRGVKLDPASGVTQHELFLCIDVDDGGVDALVRQASGIALERLEGVVTKEDLFFNPSRKQVEARRRTYWQDLVLSEKPCSISDDERCRDLLFEYAKQQLDSVTPPNDSEFGRFLIRVRCLSEWAPELELPSCDATFLESLLHELTFQKRSFAELQKAPWLDWLQVKLTDYQRQAVQKEAPDRYRVPSGKQLQLQYEVGKPPILAVRIQDMFGCQQTPRIGFGRVPVLLHLLAPNMRPQQITDDLASFWKNTYPVVRKELRRRYPKHAWPEKVDTE